MIFLATTNFNEQALYFKLQCDKITPNKQWNKLCYSRDKEMRLWAYKVQSCQNHEPRTIDLSNRIPTDSLTHSHPRFTVLQLYPPSSSLIFYFSLFFWFFCIFLFMILSWFLRVSKSFYKLSGSLYVPKESRIETRYH